MISSLSSLHPAARDHQDLRDFNDGGDNFITAVMNQDDPVQCNACTAFAVAATVEGAYNKKHLGGSVGNLDAKKLFSEAGPRRGCQASHWWPVGALEWSEESGLETASGQRIKISSSIPLIERNFKKTQRNMKDCLDGLSTMADGPVVAVMVQYEDFAKWGKYWQDNNPPNTPNPHVYFPGAPMPGSNPPIQGEPGLIVGGHVVSIIGYDDRGAAPFWICKNSWGDKWNGNGFVNIAQAQSSGPGPVGTSGCYIDLIDVWGVSST